MATAKKNEIIEIKPVQMETVSLTIVGDTPLIVHKWPEKARRELLKDTGIGKKVPRNMYAEAAATLWWMDIAADPFSMAYKGGNIATFDEWIEKYKGYGQEDYIRDVTGARFGFPVTAIKKAAISAAYRNEMSKDKVSLQGCFFIPGEGEDQLAEIVCDGIPSIREDGVKVGMGTADLRYRAQFESWHMNILLRYNVNGKLSLSDIINIINLGGQTNGIGEWRIEKSGQFGMFHVKAD